MTLALVALMAIVALVWPLHAQDEAGRRVALVIGNGAYEHVPELKNPKNDSEDLAEALMVRIDEAMPRMTVPLVAQLILDAGGAMDRAEVSKLACQRITEERDSFLLTEEDAAESLVDSALEHMLHRNLLELQGTTLKSVAPEVSTLRFYANSHRASFAKHSATAE